MNPVPDAKRDLAMLPPSERRTQAMQLLADIERGEEEMQQGLAALEKSLAKLEPTKAEKELWRWVSWLSIALACYALYSGVSAIFAGEFCSRTRGGSSSCSHGLNAQIQGLSVVLVGLLVFLAALPAARWRTVALWIGGGLLCIAVFGGLLVRS